MLPVEDRRSGCELYPPFPERIRLAGVSFDHGVHSTQGNIETLTAWKFRPCRLGARARQPT